MTVKNARASRALRRALDPGQYWLASLTQLCFATSAKCQKKFLAPPRPNPGSASVKHYSETHPLGVSLQKITTRFNYRLCFRIYKINKLALTVDYVFESTSAENLVLNLCGNRNRHGSCEMYCLFHNFTKSLILGSKDNFSQHLTKK